MDALCNFIKHLELLLLQKLNPYELSHGPSRIRYFNAYLTFYLWLLLIIDMGFSFHAWRLLLSSLILKGFLFKYNNFGILTTLSVAEWMCSHFLVGNKSCSLLISGTSTVITPYLIYVYSFSQGCSIAFCAVDCICIVISCLLQSQTLLSFSFRPIQTQILDTFYICCMLLLIWNCILSYWYTKSMITHEEDHTKFSVKQQAPMQFSQKYEKQKPDSPSQDIKDLIERKCKLEEALKAKDQMIARVSHDMRNALNSLLGSVDLLLEETKDQKCREMLDISKVCGEILLNMINGLLEAAKMEEDKLELNISPFDMYEFWDKVWKVNMVKIKQKNLDGEIFISRNFPRYLMIDSHRMMQVLLNLLSNAIKFTEKGSIKLFISWHDQNEAEETLMTPSNFYTNQATSKSNKPSDGELFIPNVNLEREPTIFQNETSFSKMMNEDDQIDPGASYINSKSKWFSEMVTSRKNIDGIDEIESVEASHHVVYEGSKVPKFIKDIYSEKYEPFRFQRMTNASSSYESPSIHSPFRIPHRPTNFSVRNSHLKPEESIQEIPKKGIIRLEIIDTGCGISKAAQSKLFQPFVQEDASITSRYGGSGLGLFIIKKILAKMGGNIKLNSEKNTGSDFIVLIPSETVDMAVPKLSMHLPESFEMNNQPSTGKRVLVVDDDQCNAKVLQSYLEKLGMSVTLCTNGREAITEYCKRNSGYYSLITMDLKMPEVDGLACARMIRNHETAKGYNVRTPIVVITGSCDEKEKKHWLDPVGGIWASHFYRKPINFLDCKSFVWSLLKERESLAKNRILIVDEDPFNTMLLSKLVQENGFACDIIHKGEESVKAVMENPQRYGYILVNCEMTSMDGISATKQIKNWLKKSGQEDIQIVGITGNVEEIHAQRCLVAGMSKVFQKPMDLGKLVRYISRR